jgi:DNA-binding MarR family transcriptional regulator
MSANTIEQNIGLVLQALKEKNRTGTGETWVSGKELAKETNLEPPEINDAVDLLATNRLVEVLQALGTAPYMFECVTITPKGRYELERAKKETTATGKPEAKALLSVLPPTPVGSPYGFTDGDWEIVAERKSKVDELRVVVGCQFESKKYDTKTLKANLQATFQSAVNEYNKKGNVVKVTLHFQPLEAGYGEHLFNEIAREIISADIAVFDTSDLNSNVMIEMGVALTWGIRVLPIKEESCPKPPSDISGQTWTDYRNSAAEFVDVNHMDKLIAMIERAARKKGRA